VGLNIPLMLVAIVKNTKIVDQSTVNMSHLLASLARTYLRLNLIIANPILF